MYTKIQNLNKEMNQERKVCVLTAVFFPSDLDVNTGGHKSQDTVSKRVSDIIKGRSSDIQNFSHV